MPVTGPSIKGVLFEPVVADVLRLIEAGRLTETELEDRLPATDLAFLGSKPNAALWYPIETYTRLLELLVSVEGSPRPQQYLWQRGARAAERLIDRGLYSQLNASVETWGEKTGRIMVTLAPAIYNFGQWSSSLLAEGAQLTIEAIDVEPFPEVSRTIVEGFIETIMARALGAPVQVKSERPTPGRIVFHGRARS
jgi:hypothetical protein